MRFFALAALAYVATAVQIEAEPTELAPADELEEVELPEPKEDEMVELDEKPTEEDDLAELPEGAEPCAADAPEEQVAVEEGVDEESGRRRVKHTIRTKHSKWVTRYRSKRVKKYHWVTVKKREWRPYFKTILAPYRVKKYWYTTKVRYYYK